MRLRTINRWLHRVGWCLFVIDHGEDAADVGRTSLVLHWIGLPRSKRRRAWDAKWMVDVPHLPELQG